MKKIVLVLACLFLAACGSSSAVGNGSQTSTAQPADNTSPSTGAISALNRVGTYDGYDIHEFTVDGFTCIFATEDWDNEATDPVSLSCNPTVSTTTTTNPFGP